MKLLLVLVLCWACVGMVSCRRKIQCRLLQSVQEAVTTPAPKEVHIINSTEFEMIMMKLDALDLRLIKTEFALQNTVHTIANDVVNLGQVVEKMAWVASQTELSSSFVEHHVKLIEYNLTTLQKDVRDLLNFQQRLPTRNYIENALVKLKFTPAPQEPITEQKMQTIVETMQAIMDEPMYEYCDQLPKSKASGVYVIQPDGDFREPMKVLCNQTFLGGGWTVFQSRFNGTVNFYRDYREYSRGFGKMDSGEFWLGLDRVHRLTYSAPHELVVVLEDWEGVSKYARYENFEVAGEFENFKVNKIDGYTGTAGDSLDYILGAYFSSFDQDHDTNERDNCAIKYHGAWWYKSCHSSNLNGKYFRGNTTEFGAGMNWNTFHGMNYALKSSMLMIRRRLDMIDLAATRNLLVKVDDTVDEKEETNTVE
ncbi:microfibril-associated glycoprotein 4-like [Malaya genurostris]|uniref:microfibril-associated glycoprotein 4-like n=1 Tax=Malaya genurostris TaxID=325434 RepID=UPI0026F389E1|nr:microfibril-associated glycoprotein 4-like [Malaya genurostris]